jgi:hypothetical protein
MSCFILPSFSEDTPNKIGNGIKVSGKNSLIKIDYNGFRVAIADEPIDAKVDGKKLFCFRVDNAVDSEMIFGFTPMETFDSNRKAHFGWNGFTGAGLYSYNGHLCYPVNKDHNIIDGKVSEKAKEIIVILDVSNNGTNKEICFLCDGNKSKSSDVSEYLKGDRLFPAFCLAYDNQQITAIPIEQIKIRTPEIEELIKEHQQQQNPIQIPLLPSVSKETNNQVIAQLRQQISDDQRILIQEKDKQIQEMRKSCEETRKDFLKQLEVKEKQSEESRKDLLKQLEETRKDFLKQIEMKEKQVESKDQQLQREREIANKQLELERAENQQLRNLLQHKKDEMSAMEIYYLKRESGQRREREEEFKVKEEPKQDE